MLVKPPRLSLLRLLLAMHDRGRYYIECDRHAAQHYGDTRIGVAVVLWRMRCYVRGFVSI